MLQELYSHHYVLMQFTSLGTILIGTSTDDQLGAFKILSIIHRFTLQAVIDYLSDSHSTLFKPCLFQIQAE